MTNPVASQSAKRGISSDQDPPAWSSTEPSQLPLVTGKHSSTVSGRSPEFPPTTLREVVPTKRRLKAHIKILSERWRTSLADFQPQRLSSALSPASGKATRLSRRTIEACACGGPPCRKKGSNDEDLNEAGSATSSEKDLSEAGNKTSSGESLQQILGSDLHAVYKHALDRFAVFPIPTPKSSKTLKS